MNRQFQVRRNGESILIQPKQLLAKPEYRIQLCSACPLVEICSRTLTATPPTATITLSNFRSMMMGLEPNRPFSSINITQTVGDMANCTLPIDDQKKISIDVAAQNWKSYID